MIELLVVVAIVALLAALLMPALGKAREKAKTIQCASNQRQLGIAFHLYADEHDDTFPNAYWCGPCGVNATGGWIVPIYPYVSGSMNVFRCPSDKDAPWYVMWAYGQFAANHLSLGPYTNPYEWLGRRARFGRPSETAVLMDGYASTISPDFGYGFFVIYRHNDGLNVLYVDGRAAWMKSPVPYARTDVYWDGD